MSVDPFTNRLNFVKILNLRPVLWVKLDSVANRVVDSDLLSTLMVHISSSAEIPTDESCYRNDNI
jgi:hypothetical protein